MTIFSFIGHILTKLFEKYDNWRQIYEQVIPTFYTASDVYLQNNVLRRKNYFSVLTTTFFLNLLRFTPLRVHTHSCLITS